MNIRILTSLAAMLPLLLALSCTSSLESTYNSQETKIDSYINSIVSKSPDTRVVHNSGAHRIVLAEGEGEELSKKGTLGFYYAGYVFSNGISNSGLFATNHRETAEASSWNVSGTTFDIEVMKLSKDGLVPGLYNGLQGVRAGEECIILFSGKYAFGKTSLGTIPANSALAYHIWVESINND